MRIANKPFGAHWRRRRYRRRRRRASRSRGGALRLLRKLQCLLLRRSSTTACGAPSLHDALQKLDLLLEQLVLGREYRILRAESADLLPRRPKLRENLLHAVILLRSVLDRRLLVGLSPALLAQLIKIGRRRRRAGRARAARRRPLDRHRSRRGDDAAPERRIRVAAPPKRSGRRAPKPKRPRRLPVRAEAREPYAAPVVGDRLGVDG